MKSRLITIGIVFLISIFALSACSSNAENEPAEKQDTEMETNSDKQSDTEMESGSDDHMEMDHSSTGEVPDDLKAADNPTYEVGSQAIIQSEHMKGMKGAKATIAGAFHTTVYSVSYTPTTGGERVKNHKWVIHEEIADAKEVPFEPGSEVTIEASHMKGMKGATAVIETAKETTVYMVDYMPTTGGDKVTNHKWVTENELSPIE
ncbi:YdhK family protein [Virgibacillus oceani]|uniref:DUF1541 domain-containing protein n=1 Tax=Virgibacillus oceani TaxID=1479511 RepID=A0A917M3Y7_9BACI|nr:YdhK family protein [Virgibacillus oceani]GGG75818.1 hypothetical protein GCM10011398_20900 [Virgibacillus oceani]